MPVHKLSAMGSVATNKIDYPSMLAGYGDFGAMTRLGYAAASGSSNSLSFSNIPSGHQDLMVVLNARSTNASTTTQAIMFFNGDTGSSSYSATWLNGDGSSASSSRQTNFSQLYCVDGMPAASATSGIFSTTIFHILNYTSTSAFKTVLIRQSADLNGSGLTRLTAGLWRATPAAITSLGINTVSGNYASGSTISLYGVKASAA